jgi:centromeric protein E
VNWKKERIALELEEEKKAKEQRDKRLIEQAKKIENLSSMVLNSERDDRSIAFSKVSCHNLLCNM